MAATSVVSAAQLRVELGNNGTVVLDAREPQEYRSGHLPGAINLTLQRLERTAAIETEPEVPHLLAGVEELAALLQACGICLQGDVVSYDEGKSYSAARLFWILEYLGHPQAVVLDGGLAAWRSTGGSLTTVTPVPRHGDFVPVPEQDKIADFAYVRSHLNDPDTILCNSLPEGSFRLEAIPGSVNLPYTETFATGSSSLIRPLQELRTLLERRGLAPDRELIVYCGVGYTAAQDYLAARLLGYPRVRLYDGSLADWKARRGPLQPGTAVPAVGEPR